VSQATATPTPSPTPSSTPTPTPGAGEILSETGKNFIDAFGGLFSGLTTAEERLAATILIVGISVVFNLLLPWIVRSVGSFVRSVVLDREPIPEEVTDYDYIIAESLLVRLIQLGVTIFAILSLLLIWGFVDTAAAVTRVLGIAAPTAGRAVVTLLLIAVALVGTDLLQAKMEAFAESSTRINRHQQGIVFQVIRVSLLIAVGLTVLSVWDFQLSGLLVGAGFLGIVVGIAAQQTLSSLIAGFVIMFSRPFELGDWVEISEVEGVVTDITIMNTRLRTAWGDTVVLPNDRVSNSKVTNHTEQNRLRLSVDVGVDYSTDLDKAREIALEAIDTVEKAQSVPTPQVLPKAFGDSAVVLECRFWINNPSARTRALAIADVVQAIKQRYDEEDVKIPFPQRELMGRQEEGGFHVSEPDETAERSPVESDE
jgi:small-conductance mechanosensitive channel